ncbi:MAG: FAD-binding oxidoreductase [Rhodospirillales bacterium]|nr:FAD-binding oxidoreductase [Rhodospirillales bacterium]
MLGSPAVATTRSPDALVIGAGVIGGAVAFELARRGFRVTVVEGKGVASGASGAAEGLVGSIAKRKMGAVTDIVIESYAMFSGLGEALGAEIEFAKRPGLTVVDDEQNVPIMKQFVEKKRARGLDIVWLDHNQVRDMEPLLAHSVVGAALTASQGLVNPFRLTRAYLAAARRLGGGEVIVGAPVTGIERERGRITAVRTKDRRIPAGLVVNAAGCGAEAIAALADEAVPIVPKRAQMLVSEALPPGTLRTTIYCSKNMVTNLNPVTLDFEDVAADGDKQKAELANPWQLSSFTQTANGNILFCGGFGIVGPTDAVDPEAVAAIAENMGAVIPSFRSLRIIRAWAGLEPCTPSNLPVIGRARHAENLFHAAGHGNAGIMMSPFTGKIVAELIAEGHESPVLQALAAEHAAQAQ